MLERFPSDRAGQEAYNKNPSRNQITKDNLCHPPLLFTFKWKLSKYFVSNLDHHIIYMIYMYHVCI